MLKLRFSMGGWVEDTKSFENYFFLKRALKIKNHFTSFYMQNVLKKGAFKTIRP